MRTKDILSRGFQIQDKSFCAAEIIAGGKFSGDFFVFENCVQAYIQVFLGLERRSRCPNVLFPMQNFFQRQKCLKTLKQTING